MKGRSKSRQVARTLLLVGEGDAEEFFLRHLCDLYVQRGSGVRVTVKNARGKGAAHVVDYAIRQSRNAEYDVKAALLDTDTDRNDRTRAAARRGRIHVVACEPCLEAVLLTLHRVSVEGGTAQLKQEFAARFGAPASEPTVPGRHLGRALLDEARMRVPQLQDLLGLLTKADV